VRVRPAKGMYGESNSMRYLPRSGAAAPQMPAAGSVNAVPIVQSAAVQPAPAVANQMPWKRTTV